MYSLQIFEWVEFMTLTKCDHDQLDEQHIYMYSLLYFIVRSQLAVCSRLYIYLDQLQKFVSYSYRILSIILYCMYFIRSSSHCSTKERDLTAFERNLLVVCVGNGDIPPVVTVKEIKRANREERGRNVTSKELLRCNMHKGNWLY